MKRTWILALALGIIAPVGFVGCGETTETKHTEQVKTPSGTNKVENIQRETKTGDQKENK